MKGVVSKETVVLRRWGSSIQKFGFINGVDKTKFMFELIQKSPYTHAQSRIGQELIKGASISLGRFITPTNVKANQNKAISALWEI